jgi:hypothetical protein
MGAAVRCGKMIFRGEQEVEHKDGWTCVPCVMATLADHA